MSFDDVFLVTRFGSAGTELAFNRLQQRYSFPLFLTSIIGFQVMLQRSWPIDGLLGDSINVPYPLQKSSLSSSLAVGSNWIYGPSAAWYV